MRLAALSLDDFFGLKKLQMVHDDSIVHFGFISDGSGIHRASLQHIQDSSSSPQTKVDVLYSRQIRVRMSNLSDHYYLINSRSFV